MCSFESNGIGYEDGENEPDQSRSRRLQDYVGDISASTLEQFEAIVCRR